MICLLHKQFKAFLVKVLYKIFVNDAFSKLLINVKIEINTFLFFIKLT